MSEFTERQAEDWPHAIAEAQKYVDTSTISPHLFDWLVTWEDETRPGRGHRFDGIWLDGEYVVQITMDVYGYPAVSVAETYWLHNSSDEECDCDPCTKTREEEE